MSSGSRSNTPTLIQRSTEVDEYYKFSIEDTAEGGYRDFCSYLQDTKGWKRMPLKKRPKLQSKLPLRKEEVPLLYCVLNERDIDFNSLQAHQVCNHFEGMGRALTTKSGFCDLLREMNWSMVDSNTIAPRSYNLGDPVQREEFVDDFKLSAAVNILKYVLRLEVGSYVGVPPSSSSSSSSSSSGRSSSMRKRNSTPASSKTAAAPLVPASVLKSAMKACARYIRVKIAGEWPGVDKEFKADEKSTNVDPNEWTELMEMSYKIADSGGGFTFNFEDYLEREHVILNSSSNVKTKNNMNTRIWLILRAMYNVNRSQMSIDGTKNIWIIKAPEACKGVGIKLLYKLHDILDCEKGMGGRTAQKYIENPLLAPFRAKATVGFQTQDVSPRDITCVSPLSGSSSSSSSSSTSVKFDLRVWVMVTSVTPLKVQVYSKVYGRCCCSQYTDELSNLADTSMHLTNFAIQKNHVFNNNNSNNSNNSDGVNNENSAGNGNNDNNNIYYNDSSSGAKNYGTGVTGMLNRLRASIKKAPRDEDNANSNGNNNNRENGGLLNKSDLLLTHEDVVKIVASASNVDKTWDADVWPDIKNKIMQTLQAVCCSGNVTHRDKSFEFLGFDVMLDNNLTPWILEINMSPALAHRGGQHSSMIAHMATGIVDTAIIAHTGTPSIDKLQPLPQQKTFQGSSAKTDIITDETETSSDTPTDAETDCSIYSSSIGLGEWQDLEIEDKTCLLPPYLVRNLISEGLNEKPSSSSLSFLSGKSTRPASAGKIRPSQKQIIKSDWDDVQYTAPKLVSAAPIEIVGKIMAKPAVQTIDQNLEILGKMRLIQAWFRRFLSRTRQYHKKRSIASITVQRVIRGFVGKQRLWHLKRRVFSIVIQCKYRCRLAAKRCESLKRYYCAIKIQCKIRRHQANKKMHSLLLNAKALIIQMFLIRSVDRWYRKAAQKIVRRAKGWCIKRWQQARKVRSVIALYYRKRNGRVKVIQRFVRRCFVRWRLFHIMKKMRLKVLSEEAMGVVEKRREEKLKASKEEEMQMNRIREDVLYLMDEMITKIEKSDLDDKKERMNSDNSGFLYDFVDRYETDRKRIHDTLPHTIKNIMTECDNTGYEFEDAPPTSLENDNDQPVNFRVSFAVEKTGHGSQVEVALGVDRRGNSSSMGMSHLSRIGAGVIDKKMKDKARDQASAPISLKARRHHIMEQFQVVPDSESGVPEFISPQQQHHIRTKIGKKRVISASKRYRDDREDERISYLSISKPAKATEKKKTTKKKKSKSHGPIINIFDTACPPDFDFAMPPSIPQSRPPNIARPEPKYGNAKENSRPFSRSSPANRRTDFIASHKGDYLEALQSLHNDLDMAAKHYAHHGVSSEQYREEEYSREPLSPLHSSNLRNSKKETTPPGNGRPEFVINRREHEKGALERMRERELEKKKVAAAISSRPRSASAIRKSSNISSARQQVWNSSKSITPSSTSRPQSADRRAKSAKSRNSYNNSRSDIDDGPFYDEKYIEKNILGVKESDCIFPGIRNSFDFSAFEPPSLEQQIFYKERGDDMGKPPIVPLKKQNGSYQYEKELKQVLFRIA